MASVYPGDPKTPHAIKEALLDHVEPPRIGTPKNSTLNIRLTSDIRFWGPYSFRGFQPTLHIRPGVPNYSSTVYHWECNFRRLLFCSLRLYTKTLFCMIIQSYLPALCTYSANKKIISKRCHARE